MTGFFSSMPAKLTLKIGGHAAIPGFHTETHWVLVYTRAGDSGAVKERTPAARANPAYFHYIYSSPMLDLGFVRDHLPKIEAMLRDRGMNPEVLLKDFRDVDAQRRQAITSAEELKAHRNRLSDKIPEMKKAGAGREPVDRRNQGNAGADSGTGEGRGRV